MFSSKSAILILNIAVILDIEYPERRKLKIMDKVPQYPPGMRAPKMQKRLKYMRGPEEVHNSLLYKQYGIIVSPKCYNLLTL